MRMRKSLFVLMATMAAMAVYAGDSAPFLLDTVTTTSTQTVDSLSVSWDASWIGGNAGATVVIVDNGTEIKRTTSAGKFVYAPLDAGLHALTYTTYIGGVAQDEIYTATFKKVMVLTTAMVGPIGNVTYSGSAHKPEPVVTDSESGVTLVKGTDYTLSWGANTAAGSGSVTVTGKGNYQGAITRTFTIAKRAVTLTSGSASKAYDGTALTKHEVAVSGDGFAAGEGASYAYTGAQTDIGSSENTFTYTLNSNTKASNYEITTVNGTLTVTTCSYSVKFNKNGGTGTMANESFTYGTAKALTANAFTRTGHAFVGWMTSANGTSIAYTDGQSVLNLTNQANATVNLYAKWTDKWYVNAANGNDANQGDTASRAFKTIQHALDKAVAGMSVVVADGTYAPIRKDNLAITIQSVNGASKTIIDGGYPTATNRCVYVGGASGKTNTVIRGFTIQNGCTLGLTSGIDGAGVAGGTLYDCVVRFNHAGHNGGGAVHSAMYNCTISDNDALAGGGGAQSARLMNCLLANNCCVSNGAAANGGVLVDCLVISNRSEMIGGGTAFASLTNCTVIGNVALDHGGGVYKGNMYGCIATNNIAHQYGGGVYGGIAEKCSIVDNQAYKLGGGAYNTTIYDSDIRCNKSTNNGAGAYYCNLYNCILANNVSSSSSGGAHRGQLENCLVYGNRASGKGGGIVNAIARNCTIYGNTCGISGGGAYADLENGLSTGTNYNCIVYGNTCAVDPEIDARIPSFNCYTNDPHFIRAEAGDFRLRHNSPCINAGSNEYVTNTVDFAGNARIVGGTVDIGAYEFSEAIDTNYTVQVVNGTGSGIYYEGDAVTIAAENRLPRYGFTHWLGDVSSISDVNSTTNVFMMPAQNLSFTAEYEFFGEPFAVGDVTVSNYSNKYDGAAHGIGVTVADGIAGAVVKYSTAVNDEFTAAAPTLTDVGSMTVWCEISAPGYLTQTNSATVTVSKRTVTLTSGSASKAYDGSPLVKQTVTVGGDGFVSGEGATYSYVGSQTSVGSSANGFVYTLNDNTKAGNYTITTQSGTLAVTKATNSWITQPSIAGWTYGQAANAPNLGAAQFGNVQVSYSATPQNAGSYTATFTVPETANYSALSKSVSFAIARATYDMSGAKWNYAGEFTYDGGIKTVVVSGLPLGVSVSAYSGNSAVAPGTYTAHATLGYDSVNFNAPSIADLSWSIKSSEGSKLEEIFDDLPADITPDDAGGWKVTVTNDIDSTDLPIDIPDNLGHVTIDLRGHDLIGADGAAGSNTTPGGDGKSAIRVVAGDGSGGTATRLTIVTTGGDALVKGGDGGAGNPGGSGAAAIAVLGDCQAGVKIDVGAGVTVRGGRGGDSVSGRGGDGGAGIEGDVGTNDGTIIGGDGGDSASGDGGDGGPGVDGNIDVNNGSITGGDGGSSDTGRGGDGGMGTTGDVGTNDGTISGGGGGGSAQGEDGDDGKSVGGTIGGGSGTVVKVKVPVPEVPSAEYTGEVVEPQVPASGLYAVSASGGTRPGSYPVMLTLLDAANYEWIPRDGATVNGALAVVNFVIVDPPPRIETEGGGKSGRENAASVTATYDGRGHGISVTVTYPPTGAKIRYARAAKGPFTDEKPLFTNAVDAAETWYVLSADGFDSVTNMATVTIVPKPLSAVMVAGKRLVEDAQGRVSAALTLADIPPCALTASDWELASWQPRASGGGTATVRGKGNYTGMLSVDVPNEMTVVFDAVYGNGGDVRTVTTQTPGSAYVLPLRAPQYRGYDFLGWFTEREGGSPVTSGRKVSLRDPDVVYAHWKIRRYRTTFELNGGTGDFSPLTFDYGSTYPELQVPAKAGYLFDGWWSTSDFAKGSEVCEDDAVPASDTTLYAKWLRRRLWYSEQAFHLESSAVWEGYLVDPGNGDSVVGTITLKAGKPNPRTGLAKLTATVLIAGERKVTVKGETFDGSLSAKAKDGRTLEIKLGASSMTGRFDRYEIDGALNVFTAKDAASKMRAAQELKLRQGVYMIAWDDAGWTGLSLTVAAKGKVKVSGTLADGTRVNAKSQLLVGERESAIAVSWAKKTSSVSFLMWFCEDGSIECSNLQGGLVAMAANARDGAYLVDGAAFRIDAAAIAAAIPDAETELLPDGLPVRMNGAKFDIDRAGRVSLLRDKSGFDLSKAGANPSGLKLTYSIRNCTFKGGFTVYANVAGRLKKVKVTVSGVVLGRKGYGTATVKKIGSWPVVIE